jgi:tetratricopeptide (TPR) repeat protein
MYRYADRLVGRWLDAMVDRTTLVVLSDHGFQLGALPDDPSKLRDMRRVSERFHDIEGILYFYGNHVRRGVTIEQPTRVDVAPTLLTLVGLSPAEDMPGRVLTEALDVAEPARSVATYEPGKAVAAADGADTGVDPAILDHLRSLGYLDTQSPRSARNFAAIHFEKGEYEEAARAYAALVAEKPDDGQLRASLAGALGALGRYDEALAQLAQAVKLAPLNPEARYNRGIIFERQGKPEAALDEYRTLLRYTPDYAPARQALVRLTGSAERAAAPSSDAERQAADLCRTAGEAARRGDYDEAWKRLDEAAALAPDMAQVYQYRSNVAYLRGDRPAAIAALEHALEIEPDNALFRQNLGRLRAAATPP